MQIIDWLQKIASSPNRIYISSHASPDSDAIGSSFALAKLLIQRGASVEVVLSDPVPHRLVDFVEGIPWSCKVPDEPCDAVIVTDTATRKRVGDIGETLFARSNTLVNIDHHISNNSWGQINFIDPAAAAACEIILSFAQAAHWPIDQQTANLLYAGILDDTGCFRFSNVSANSLVSAAKLVELGAEPELVANRLYFSLPAKVIKLRAHVLGSLESFFDGQVAVISLSQKVRKELGADTEDAGGLVDLGRSLQGAIGSIYFREDDDSCKVSLRSKVSWFDVNSIAAVFGGGGHKQAAGCILECSLDEARTRVLAQVEGALKAR